jgi:hypothetical protein
MQGLSRLGSHLGWKSVKDMVTEPSLHAQFTCYGEQTGNKDNTMQIVLNNHLLFIRFLSFPHPFLREAI